MPVKNSAYKKWLHADDEHPRIVDRNGEILAQDINSYDLYFRPYNVLNIENELLKISEILPRVKSRYKKILEKSMEKKGSKNTSILIQFGISDRERKKLLENGVIGLEFQVKKTRYYIHGSLFSHIIGLISDDGKGVSGIEKSISQGKIKPDENGFVNLSVNLQIQRILHTILTDTMKTNEAKGAFGMIADVKTGEIIAASSLPDYNPNDKSSMTFDRAFNKFSLGVYEFGSIFKLINTALALENGLPTSKVYTIKDDLELNGYKITDFVKRRDVMTLEEVVMYSSNIGSGKIALEIGHDKQREFFYNLGFGEKMNLEIPENGGFLMPQKQNWHGITSVTLSYGHGIAITQAHLLRAMISILNNGKFTNLTLLKNGNNVILDKSIISQETSSKMLSIMRKIVQFGAAKSLKSPHYDIGGKSGTAIKLLNKGGYSKEKNLLSIFAAFPMSDPKYAMVISLDEPKWSAERRLSLTGGGTLGRATSGLIEQMGLFLKIPKMQQSERDIISTERLIYEIENR
ncbi:peptidoglycan D,D-transpeptidase FtsI family protein [Candidatus Deianiraea vastatrix]|uniref:peptidoglycan D,D-transpeptidase FtsI family protein n=1 Tax=Candidatus Deianiraea vastatrix TaxID=2163644 RepID=UPI001386D8DA|nr:penicillin-binding protein 2 [Candidatus Deianiraea vastatrix]